MVNHHFDKSLPQMRTIADSTSSSLKLHGDPDIWHLNPWVDNTSFQNQVWTLTEWGTWILKPYKLRKIFPLLKGNSWVNSFLIKDQTTMRLI